MKPSLALLAISALSISSAIAAQEVTTPPLPIPTSPHNFSSVCCHECKELQNRCVEKCEPGAAGPAERVCRIVVCRNWVRSSLFHCLFLWGFVFQGELCGLVGLMTCGASLGVRCFAGIATEMWKGEGWWLMWLIMLCWVGGYRLLVFLGGGLHTRASGGSTGCFLKHGSKET